MIVFMTDHIDNMYMLWVDDNAYNIYTPDRHPPNLEDIVVASSAKEAIGIIDRLGAPYFIDLDDDLGDGLQSSKLIVKHLYDKFADTEIGFRVRYPSSSSGNWLFVFMDSWHKTKGFSSYKG